MQIDGQQHRVRLISVDAPEGYGATECYGPEVREFTTDRLSGTTVGLEKDASETDRYGRLLRYVWVVGDLFSELLVREGYSQMATYTPDVTYENRIRQAQSAARSAGAGLWSGCAEPDPEPEQPSDQPTSNSNCDPSNPNVCIPPYLNCGEIPHRPFGVAPPDPHGFDRDNDGIGSGS